jgi:hypothetical protein
LRSNLSIGLVFFFLGRALLRSPTGVGGVDSISVKLPGGGAREDEGVVGVVGDGTVGVGVNPSLDLIAVKERLKNPDGSLIGREGVAAAGA